MPEYIDLTNITMPNGLSKIPFDINYNIYQLDCQLFSNCNLNCKFCFEYQARQSKIDYNYILSIPQLSFSYLKKQIEKFNIKQVLIHSWGGQIFMDSLPDQIFTIYIQYMQKFKKLIKQQFPHINLGFIWTSNGVFTKSDRVLNFIKSTNSKIAFSYDPLYRYNTTKQMNLAIQNFKLFKDIMTCIGIMLITPAIKESILNNDPIFNSNYKIDANYYIGNTNYKDFLPSDDQLFCFYKWAIDNKKYNFNIIQMLLQNVYNKYETPLKYCNCKFHAQFINGNFTNRCSCNSNYPENIFYKQYTNDVTEQNCTEVKNILAIESRHCLSCQYYQICPMFCNISQIFKYYKMDICPLFQIINYINQNSFIKDNYFKYKNRDI